MKEAGIEAILSALKEIEQGGCLGDIIDIYLLGDACPMIDAGAGIVLDGLGFEGADDA